MTHKQRNTQRTHIPWVTPHVAIVARASSMQIQESEAPSEFHVSDRNPNIWVVIYCFPRKSSRQLCVEHLALELLIGLEQYRILA